MPLVTSYNISIDLLFNLRAVIAKQDTEAAD